MKSPKVTVLMPVYNGEKYLREAIESILNQTFKDFEFLIINDGSTDKSVEIIESFKDTRIRLVHNEKNIKLIATLNKGLDLARGEYIARMDCDDISLSERLQEQVNYLFANPQINVLGTGFQTINQKGEILEDIVYFPDSEKIIAWDLLFYCPIAHPTVMMRKKIIKEIGGYLSESDIYEKKNLYVEDYYLWSKLNNIKEFTITNISKVLLKLRKHGDNITSIYLDENKKNSALISYENMKRYFDIDITEEFIYSIVFNQLNQCEVIKSLNFIYNLYIRFIDKNNLSKSEKKIIKNDVIRKLFILTLNCKKYYKRLYYIFKSVNYKPGMMIFILKDLIIMIAKFLLGKIKKT